MPQVVCTSLSAVPLELIKSRRFDPETPIEETVGGCNPDYERSLRAANVQMRALNDVVMAGYARYIGMSSCFAWQCESAAHF